MFEPSRIGNVYLKNRIIMLPMGDGLQSESRGVSPRQIAYFEERARGGAGLIFQAATPYNRHNIRGWNIDIDSEDKLSMIRELTDAIHRHGTKIGVMLGLAFGSVFLNQDGSAPKSPSARPVFFSPDVMSESFSAEEINQIIEDYGYSAGLAKSGGYDMVHIQGYGGYLIDQFMCDRWNNRDDQFGGCFENRMRFPLGLIKSIQKYCGMDFPIVFKMSAIHLVEDGRTIEEGSRIAALLEKAGVAALHIDVGAFEENCYELVPPVYHHRRMKQFEYAGIIKEVVNIPVFTQGKIGDPEEAEAVLREGKTDFVALGRSFLADAHWPEKVRTERAEDIRPCISCNEGCIVRLMDCQSIGCAVNPICGFEESKREMPLSANRKIIVVGGGPAGMEAALTADKRGYKVELWEKKTALGGLLIPASEPIFKRDLRRLIRYYEAQIYKSGIRLRLNKCADAETVLAHEPDAVIVATGGKPYLPDICGIENECVCVACDVLLNRCDVGQRVVVAGGGFTGCETALHLAQLGKHVTLIEALPEVLKVHTALQNKQMLMRLIGEAGINVITSCTLERVADRSIAVRHEETQRRLCCDTLVLALGLKPDNGLAQSLEGRVNIVAVGDAHKPQRILDAVWAGYKAAAEII